MRVHLLSSAEGTAKADEREDVLGLTVISVVIGAVLAVAYHIISVRLQKWASTRRFTMLPLVTILGFFVRIAVFVGILVVVGLWSPLNILALCLAFVVLFTALNAVQLYTLVSKRNGAPPSNGASIVL